MGFTKEQVEQHIAGVERRLGNEQERKMHGLRFAKMCYQAKMYEDAIRYLGGYLTVQERDPSAQKFMGRVCEAAGHLDKAIAHYKRSLELKKNQRDVIISVAELYCKLEKPPLEEVKDCLRLIESISKGHPLVLSLNEKLHLLQGTSESPTMEDLITKQLAVSSQDTSLHIRLVQLYTSLGNLPNAFRYCQLMCEKGSFTDSPAWQSCVMETSEKYHQQLKASGCEDSLRLLEVLVLVLEGASALFGMVAAGQGPVLAQCAALLLKFDKVVHAAVILLRPPCPPTPYRVVVRELCGRLYHMAAEYLFMMGGRRNHLCVGVWKTDHLKMFALGDLCLLASLKATPPRMDGEWSVGVANRSLLEKWHTAACKRLCLVGRHLMMVAASRPESYINELPKQGGRLDLIRMLFSDNQHLATTRVSFGSKEISYSLKESFLAEDVSLSKPPTELPDPEDLAVCDQVFVFNSKGDLRGLLWLCVAYRALGMKPPVSEWLAELFEGVKLDTHDLGMCEVHSLCLCDLEAFLVLLMARHEAALTTPPYQLFSASKTSTSSPLHFSLMHLPPCSLEVERSDLSWWSSAIALLGGGISVHEAVPLKRDVQTGLARLRGCRPLQLNLQQLATLARHFKQRAETLVDAGEGHYWNYRDIINVLLKWSSNYWQIVVSAIQGMPEDEQSPRRGAGKKHELLMTSTSRASGREIDPQALLSEAQMALAAVALQKQDMNKALGLYSRIKTPHAAWNQSQIYLFLAEQEGDRETPRDTRTRLSNLEKASQSLAIAVSRLSPSESPVLREKLTKQQEEVHQLIDAAKKTPVVCSLQFNSPRESSPPAPDRFSTSTGEKESPGSQKEAQPVPAGHKPPSDGPEDTSKDKGDQAQQIAALAAQLQQLQEEMQELKKSHLKLSTPPTRAMTLAEFPALSPPPVAAMPPSPKASPSFSLGLSSPSYHTSQSPASKLLPSQHSTPIAKQGLAAFQTSPVGVTQTVASQPGSLWGMTQSSPLQGQSPQQRTQLTFATQATAQPQQGAQQFSPATQVQWAQPPPILPPNQSSFPPQFQLGAINFLGTSAQQPLQHFPSTATIATSQLGISSFSTHFQLGETAKPVFPQIQPGPPLAAITSQSLSGLFFESTDSASNNYSQQPFTFMQGTTPSFNLQPQGGVSSFPVPRLSHPQQSQPSMLPSFSTSSPGYRPTNSSYGSATSFPESLQTTPVSASVEEGKTMQGMVASPALSLSATASSVASDVSGSGITSFPLLSSLLSPVPSPLAATSGASTALNITPSFQFQSQASQQPVCSQPFTFKLSASGDTGLSSLGKSLFTSSTAVPTLDISGTLGQSYVEEGDADRQDEGDQSRHDTSLDTSGGPDFAPVVSLPKLEEIKSGEEDEEVLFSHRAKLFRFEMKLKEWKERGIGDMKILRHKMTSKVRLLMRREQVLKICCNHYLTDEVKPTPMVGPSSNKSWTWYTPCDFADGVPKPEKLAIRFKNPDTAQQFKAVLDECIQETSTPEHAFATTTSTPGAEPLSSKFAPPPGSWVCETCYVENSASASRCAACQTSKPGQVVPSTQSGKGLPLSIFSKFALPGSWTCSGCYIQNQPDAEKCVACGSRNPAIVSSTSTPSPITKPPFSSVFPSTSLSQSQPSGGGIQVPALKMLTLQPSTSPLQLTAYSSQPPVAGGIKVDALKQTSLQQLEPTWKSEPSGWIKIGDLKLSSTPLSGGKTEFQPFSLTEFKPPFDTSSQSPVLGGIKLDSLKQTSLQQLASSSQASTETKDTQKSETSGRVNLEDLSFVQPTGEQTGYQPLSLTGLKFPGFTSTASDGDKQATEFEDEHKVLEYEPDVCFKPVVTLSGSVDLKSGEEEEEVLFSHRAKLYRFDEASKQWKERGTGDMKILEHQTTGKIRLLMRRDQVLKICCNHCITAMMSLNPQSGSDRSWNWYTTCDFAEEQEKPEKFAIRFKTLDTAQQFKVVFDECVQKVSASQEKVPSVSTPQPTSTPSQFLLSKFAPPPGSWNCDACLLSNTPENVKCVACGATKPVDIAKPLPPITPEASLSATKPSDTKPENLILSALAPPPGSWSCDVCYVSNKPESIKCVSCGAARQARETETSPIAALTENVERDAQSSDEESVVITDVEMPPLEKLQLAEKYMLPPTFYNYENSTPCPGCRGCTDEDGKPLYPQNESSSARTETTGDTVDEQSDKEDEKVVEQVDKATKEASEQQPTSSKDAPIETKAFGGFFSSTPGFSFADLAASSSGDSTSIFGGKGSKSPGFSRAGEVLFVQSPTHKEDYDPEAEANVHFKPLVKLPEVIVKTGEEEEEIVFSHRAKLFRFENKISQWKERGVGDIKLLRNKSTNKTRVIMRRDQVLKICCNHSITADMSLLPNAGSEKSWMWYTPCDFADEIAKPEKLAVKFKHVETAQEFKKIFDNCVSWAVQQPPVQSAGIEKISLVEQASEEIIEVRKPLSSVQPDEALRERLAPPADSWTCNVCYIINTKNTKECEVCGSPNPARGDCSVDSPLRLPLDLTTEAPPTTISSPLRLPLDLGSQVVSTQSQPSPLVKEESEAFSAQVLGLVHKPTSKDQDICSPTTSQATQEIPDINWSTVGEKDEELFSQHGRLLVEDIVANDWKEKGSGGMKVIRHTPTGKLRLLMLSEDSSPTVLCSHPITSLMHLRGAGKENAWVWCSATDYASGKANTTVQKFCIELDSAEAAVAFKNSFDASSRSIASAQFRASPQLLSDEDEDETPIPKPSLFQPPPQMQSEREKEQLAESEDDAIFLYEELPDPDLVRKAEELMLPKSFYLYEKKPPCRGCRGCRDEIEYQDASQPKEHGSSSAVAEDNSLIKAVEHGSHATVANEEEKKLGEVRTTEQQIQLPHEAVGQTTTTSQAESLPFERGTFSSAGMISFADLSSSGFGSGIGQRSPNFRFQGMGQQLFAPKKEAGEIDPEAEADVHFKPIVALPKTYAFTSWDDEADVLFSHRAKLFRFVTATTQWKERGIGDIKIARHRQTGKVRIIMRRDQILKICCNHYITPGMSLTPKSEKSWMWLTQSDFTDETPKEEKLVVKFKHAEKAQEFKEVFDMCLANLPQEQTSQTPKVKAPQIHPKGSESLASKFQPKAGSWECSACYVQNAAENKKCLACNTAKEGSESDETSQPLACAGLASQLSAFQERGEVLFGSSGGIKLSLPQSVSLQSSQASSPFQPIQQSTINIGSTGLHISATPDCPSAESK